MRYDLLALTNEWLGRLDTRNSATLSAPDKKDPKLVKRLNIFFLNVLAVQMGVSPMRLVQMEVRLLL